MKYLLDTHIVLWLAENSPNLSETAKTILLDGGNEKFVSIASCWEVSIKVGLNKLDLVGGTSEFFRIIETNGFEILSIERKHLKVFETLPFLHRDPFDRLLVSTAISEDMTLLSADAQVLGYAAKGLKIAH